MAIQPNDLSIGPYRRVRLKANAKGYWEVWWTDAGGKTYLTKRESTKTKVFAEAENYLRGFCDDARAAQAAVTVARVPEIEELCRRWLTYVTPLGKDRIGRQVLRAPRSLLGRYTADRLDGSVFQDYASERAPLTTGTVRRELGALRTVLIWAADEKLISRDDLPNFKRALPPEGASRVKYLDPGQEQAFWDQAMGPGTDRRVMLFVALGLETATRKSAILELTWDRVDLGLGTIDYRVPGQRLTKKRRVQGMPVSDRLMPVLKEAWLRAPKDRSGHALGPVVGGTEISRPFKRFARAIGMEWVTPHVLRHTWASLAAMNGVPLLTIAQVMGDTVATVEAYYAHLSPGHLRAAINHKAGSGAVMPARSAG